MRFQLKEAKKKEEMLIIPLKKKVEGYEKIETWVDKKQKEKKQKFEEVVSLKIQLKKAKWTKEVIKSQWKEKEETCEKLEIEIL